MGARLASAMAFAWFVACAPGCACEGHSSDAGLDANFDDGIDAGSPGIDAGELDARVPVPYACVDEFDCGGLPCVEGHCPCASNAQCRPFLFSPPAACSDGFCVAACPFTDSPRETPSVFLACDDPRDGTCCVPGERCCPSTLEVLQCLPGDRPCWPQCPDRGRTCAPDTWCPGAEIASGAVLRCSEVLPLRDADQLFPPGVLSGVGCAEACPAERQCGAQTCCAEGTVCFLPREFDPIPADGDPGIGRDVQWYAQPAGFYCIPD